MIAFDKDLQGCTNIQKSGDITIVPSNDDEYNIAVAYRKYLNDNGLPKDAELDCLLSQYNYGWSVRHELASYLETLPIVVKIPLGDPVVQH